MDLDKAIKSRKSVRKYTGKKPDWRDIIDCIDSMRYAPSAGGIFPIRVILVIDKEKIKKIAKASQQDFIIDASYVLVVTSITSRTITSFGKKGETYLKQQAGAAIENLLLKVQEKNLDACWVGHFVESQIKRELKIPDDANIEAIIPIGYAFPELSKKEKKKTDLDNILYFNNYGVKKMKSPKEFSA